MTQRSREGKDRPRVLLAEDDTPMRELLGELLRDEGYDVVEASDGRELLLRVEEARAAEPFHVVISDLCMPVVNGLDVAQRWATLGRGPRLILMSAFPEPNVRTRAAELGVVLLEKPFPLPTLCDLLDELCQRGEPRA